MLSKGVWPLRGLAKVTLIMSEIVTSSKYRSQLQRSEGYSQNQIKIYVDRASIDGCTKTMTLVAIRDIGEERFIRFANVYISHFKYAKYRRAVCELLKLTLQDQFIFDPKAQQDTFSDKFDTLKKACPALKSGGLSNLSNRSLEHAWQALAIDKNGL